MPLLEYMPAVVLIGYGAYKWHKTGMRKDLWTMALGASTIVILAASSYTRHLVGISPQMHILYGTISIVVNMLMSIAVVAFMVTEWRR